MAEHAFGIMNKAPAAGKRYDSYEPEKYVLISVDDEWIQPLLPKLQKINCFWHSLDVEENGLAYCGITLIPPGSVDDFVEIIKEFPKLDNLKRLLLKAKAKGQFIIHYGL